MQLSDSITTLKGIGEKKALAFEKLGVFSLYDLLTYFPRRYEDRTLSKPIALTVNEESCCLSAVIATEPRLVRVRRGMELVKFRIADESGTADLTFFNQSYLKNHFRQGEEYSFYGKVEVAGNRRSMVNPLFEKESQKGVITGRILPVYGMTRGLNQKTILQVMEQALAQCGDFLPELLPEEILRKEQLARASFAYENIHFPADFDALALARRRLVYEELFLLSCALGRMRGERIREPGQKLRVPDFSPFFSRLPYAPTDAQHRAIAEAVEDLQSGHVMNRLIQGDVGSGKTTVAAALCFMAWKNGLQSAFMAPTEILAEQHCETLTGLLSPLGIRVGLLTGSSGKKSAVKKALAAGELDLIIGTHALISQDIAYANLGLVITDEQHRFGVAQRAALSRKGQSPHVLVMSATPIPRTLALIIYGDLDVSVMDELPPGRQKVDTFAVDESYRQRLNAFIAKQCAEGSQVFVVCPAVQENEESDLQLKSAEEHCQTLARQLPDCRVACVHGKMKPAEKESAMAAFSRGETDVLVSTTVVEVGVDVPNATLMIIENAERFGLSQLHQLRGRVGRGAKKSWCILVSDHQEESVRARLDIMCKTNDGFKIAEEDLRLRGPGDFFGNRQHGLPEMHLADLGADTKVLLRAQEDARALLSRDPDLNTCPELKARIDRMYANI